MGVMCVRAAMNIFWQLVSNVRETNISHVCDTFINKTRSPKTTCLIYRLAGGSVCHKYVTNMSNVTYLSTDPPYLGMSKCDIFVYRPTAFGYVKYDIVVYTPTVFFR